MFTDDEAFALLIGDDRAELLAPLVAEGLSEDQAGCVLFVMLTTPPLDDATLDAVIDECTAS